VPAAVRDDLFTHTVQGPRLIAGTCPACAASTFPLSLYCPACEDGAELEPSLLSPEGTIYTCTVVRHRPPGYHGPVPYGFGLVELPERIRVSALLFADDLDGLAIGQAVGLRLLPVDEAGRLTYAFETVEGVA
jgi:uncharacterized OB-fold protein